MEADPIRVVIAEDEAIIRLDIRESLEDQGYNVVGETDRGDHALQMIRDLQPDIALLDVDMPGLDGISVAERVTEEAICAVVLLTAFSQPELVAQAGEAGVAGYLVKPFKGTELVAALHIARARFGELRAIRESRDRAEFKLRERTLIDRAKARLMNEWDWTEDQAFRALQRLAMDRRVGLSAVAVSVIEAPSLPASRELANL